MPNSSHLPKAPTRRRSPAPARKTSKPTSSLKFLHTEFDHRIDCRYLLFTLSAKDFLELTSSAHSNQGAIEGQRDVVRTTSAGRIRRRLTSDIRAGAIIPPIVLGATAQSRQIKSSTWNASSTQRLLGNVAGRLSIIDGIQRTNALKELDSLETVAPVRVELWLAPSIENLIYRMLVLNTGQIPWNLRRQLEVIHRGLIDEISTTLKPRAKIFKSDDKRRRTAAGEFQANDIIEMYMAFSLRKPHVDKETVLSDQFSKLDLVESVSKNRGLSDFTEALGLLTQLDTAFARHPPSDEPPPGKLRSGRNIFDKVSACAGFMAAYAQFVKGKVGMNKTKEGESASAVKASQSCLSVASKLNNMNQSEHSEFLALATLEEISSKRGGTLSIGESERELFLAAFRLLLEEGPHLPSMEPAWRSQ